MWIVRVALDRPYTFVVLALMILIISVVAISRTPTDIFPNIDIPVVAVDYYRQTTLSAFQQVEDNLAALSILEREAQQQDEAVDSAKNNLRLFTERYLGGRDSYLQVITAQTAYLDNERNQVEIRRRRMDATVLLVKALGGGWTAAALPKLSELDHPSNDGRLP